MPSTPSAGIPYPAGKDAPYTAADFQATVEYLDDRVVLRASDSADRDARYLTPTPGMLVTGDDGTVWIADQAGGWHTAYEPQPPWVALSIASGVASDGALAMKTHQGQVWLTGNLVSTGAGLEHATPLAWVPNGYEPNTSGSRFFATAASLVGSRTIATCRVEVHTDGLIQIADQEESPPFISIDGIQYWINS